MSQMKKEKLIESSILRSFQGTLQATARFPTGVENMGGSLQNLSGGGV